MQFAEGHRGMRDEVMYSRRTAGFCTSGNQRVRPSEASAACARAFIPEHDSFHPAINYSSSVRSHRDV
jgi:hypothetical protein